MTTATPRISMRQILDWLGPWDRAAMAAGAALVFAIGAARQGWMAGLLLALLAAMAVAIVVIDLRHYRIRDRLSLPLMPIGLAFAALSAPVWQRLVAMAVAWASLSLLRWAFMRLRGKAGLGGGDIKLITAAAAWLPVEALPLYVLAAALSGLITALVSGTNHAAPIAFGIHLAPWLLLFAIWA